MLDFGQTQQGTAGYLPLKEAATWVGVSTRTLRRWISRGLPVYRGTSKGKLLLRPTDIDEFLVREETIQPDLNEMVEEVLSKLAEKTNP